MLLLGLYRKAAKRAAAPTSPPEAILMAAAPVEEAAALPEVVDEPDWEEPPLVLEAWAPVALDVLPVLVAPLPVVLAPVRELEPETVERMRVVLLLAVATMVLLPTTMVFRPEEMAGMETALGRAGTEPTEVARGGMLGRLVTTLGWPVTRPSELVRVRN